MGVSPDREPAFRHGGWGVERGGYAGQTGFSNGFSGWYHFTGTTDSIIGYNKETGEAGTATLVNGQYRYVRKYWFPKGYTTMTGGK